MKILVVDDSTTMRRIIANSLKAAGYEDIDEAGDGLEALKKLDGVDLVLTDWNMPGMDGITLVKSIREDPGRQGLPIIMVTSEGAKDEVMEALKVGVNDYVVKPFTKDVLAAKVKALVD